MIYNLTANYFFKFNLFNLSNLRSRILIINIVHPEISLTLNTPPQTFKNIHKIITSFQFSV